MDSKVKHHLENSIQSLRNAIHHGSLVEDSEVINSMCYSLNLLEHIVICDEYTHRHEDKGCAACDRTTSMLLNE